MNEKVNVRLPFPLINVPSWVNLPVEIWTWKNNRSRIYSGMLQSVANDHQHHQLIYWNQREGILLCGIICRSRNYQQSNPKDDMTHFQFRCCCWCCCWFFFGKIQDVLRRLMIRQTEIIYNVPHCDHGEAIAKSSTGRVVLKIYNNASGKPCFLTSINNILLRNVYLAQITQQNDLQRAQRHYAVQHHDQGAGITGDR